MLLPQEIIRAKRNGLELNREQIAFFIKGVTSGAVTDSQIAAFAMAVYFQGMEMHERVALTEEMMHSGNVLQWHDMPGPIVDKHSTGGVSDSVSLMLGPLVAACGGYVPMIAGRGLGHTGGTLDKFESIPGYNIMPSETSFKQIVKDIGVAIIGQTDEIAPADKRIYGIRDVTATVDSIPMITASILSKKLSAGLGSLAMDVKTGNGAFMSTLEDARLLAESIVAVANQAGVPTSATITDMSQPLGSTAGNATEMLEAIDYLTGKYRNPRLHEVTMALAEQMLLLSGLATSKQDALSKLNHALDSGAATEKFSAMVHALGGPADLVEKAGDYVQLAPVCKPVFATTAGYVQHIETRNVGLAVVSLGGGRTEPSQKVDHAVGLTELASLGQQISADQPIAMVYARTEAEAEAAAASVQAAFSMSDQPVEAPPIIHALLEPTK
ncbi:thymidine phosphorylase [Aliidiomarina quisquiliarum]|uniref:thymidine phosphorylase n=1 Tax=Aliidiomarina quisquiliarum TaxID=2938947 RepID=UPI00208E54FF|nr:thymidine phosphorylase [Aliidiomarina quisquiliarum]MCO4322281.1 thymidine phosphorylase [Aliidiomarina quisquiliarum]